MNSHMSLDFPFNGIGLQTDTHNSFVKQEDDELMSDMNFAGVGAPDGQPLNWEDCEKALSTEVERPEFYGMVLSGKNDPVVTGIQQVSQQDTSFYSSNSSGPSPNSETGSSTINSNGRSPGHHAVVVQQNIQAAPAAASNASDVSATSAVLAVGAKDDESEKKRIQNRAAQRAFRERRDQRAKEVELKLAEVEEHNSQMKSEIERLKRENAILSTENKVLSRQHLQLQQQQQQHQSGPTVVDQKRNHPKKVMFPQNNFFEVLVGDPQHGPDAAVKPSYEVYESQKHNSVMLGAGAVWKKIIEDPSIPDDVDLDKIIDTLRDKAVCDGRGPVFPLALVEKAIRDAILEIEE